jgi:hypothetical protein
MAFDQSPFAIIEKLTSGQYYRLVMLGRLALNETVSVGWVAIG